MRVCLFCKLINLSDNLTCSTVNLRTDGDEQFFAVHQDIGRISGAASNAPNVAPQTVVRQVPAARQPDFAPAAAAPVAPALPVAAQTAQVHKRAPVRGRQPNQQQHQHHQQQLVLQQQQQQQQFQQQQPQPQQSQPQPQPLLPLLQPQVQFHQPQQFAKLSLQASPERQQQQVAVGPALTSFRSSAGHTNSVAARHSALMAQVAAERQAEQQGSLGSPIEALSSPAIAQVQPPPTLQQLQPPVAAASPPLSFINQPEEPLVAPSFEHVLSSGCPPKGVFSYENRDHCDRYYMCTNGTFTEEACPNGLAYSQMGAVYQHCAYNWNVDCGRKKQSEPLSSPGCPWQFGIFSTGHHCSIDYFVCEWGVPETKRCSPEGLFYDERIKGCQWADQLGCKSEALLNFKCPPEDEDNPYWPFPRYYHTKQDVIVCVNEQPRLVHCNEEQLVDPGSLACIDLKKKKKKF